MSKQLNSDEFNILGTWEIESCETNDGVHDNLRGVRFTLDEGDDVTWQLTPPAEEETLPLFSCRTFELNEWSEGRVLHFYMSNGGDWIEFKVSLHKDDINHIVLKSGKNVKLTCNRIIEEKEVTLPKFCLLDALNEGYFSDLTITASNGEKFLVHKTILSCLCPNDGWDTIPQYMRNLPPNILRLILHYLYTGHLPEGPSESNIKGTLKAIENVSCFKELFKLCTVFLEATAVITRITSLLNDIEKAMDSVLNILNNLCTLNHDGMAQLSVKTEPCHIFDASKIILQQVAAVALKFVLLCDIFSKRKNELTRQERHSLIKNIRDRIPSFASKLHSLLVLCQDCLIQMSLTQRKQIAAYFVPNIESFMKTVAEIGLIETLDEIVDQEESEQKKSRHSSFSGKLSRTLKNAVHIRELKILKLIQEETASLLSFLFQRREDFCALETDKKVRSMVKGMNKMIERGLPDMIDNVERVPQNYKFKEWKSFFKVGTAHISWILETVKRYKTTLEPVCNFIEQYETLKPLMVDLGLAEPTHSSKEGVPATPHKPERLSSSSLPTVRHNDSSTLSQAAAVLLDTGKYTDMTFIVTNNPTKQDPLYGKTENVDESNCDACTNGDQACKDTPGDVACDDVPGSVPEAVEIPAHRVIVAARCHWFKCALLSGMKESIDRTILVPDTSPIVFRKFLESLYLETMETKSLSDDQLIEMVILTDIYEVDVMKSTCESALCSRIHSDNVVYLLSMADRYNTPQLKDECFKYITSNENILDSEEKANLTKELQQELETRIHDAMEDVLEQNRKQLQIDKQQLEEYGIQDLQECTTRKIFEQHAIRRHRATRIEKCIQSLTEILGDSIPRRELVRVTLAADCDVNRALNFYFSWQSNDTR